MSLDFNLVCVLVEDESSIMTPDIDHGARCCSIVVDAHFVQDPRGCRMAIRQEKTYVGRGHGQNGMGRPGLGRA